MEKPSFAQIKHDVMGILFKVKTSTEILEGDGNVKSIALENISLLEKILEALFLMEMEDISREEVDLLRIVGEVFGRHIGEGVLLRGYPRRIVGGLNLIRESFSKISLRVVDNSLIIEGDPRRGSIWKFLADAGAYILSLSGLQVKREYSKIEVSWERS